MSKLNALAGGRKAGPNALLKVMGGDVVSATTQYYYQQAATNTSGSTLVADVLSSLVQAIAGSPVTSLSAKGATSGISSQLDNTVPFRSLVAPDAADAATTLPKAYLTVLFFDERFNYVGENSTTLRVGAAPGPNASLTAANLRAPKNGYAYVYVSNESQEPVYFDNLQVAHTRGRIAEETHYYSYGLQIAAISSKKVADPREGTLDNRYGYNDKELWDDGDLNWLDYGFRNYDPQIGRFVQVDPLTDMYADLSPYLYAYNDPIANVDVDGLFGEGILSTTAATAKTLSGVTVTAVRSTATVVKAGSTLMSGLRMGISVSSVLVHSAQAAIGVINTSVTVQQVGGAVAGSGPDDYIYVNTKTKQVDIIETSDDFDLVTIDGGPEVGRKKGVTENEYRGKGYRIWRPEGVGMDLVDNVILTIGGGKAAKWAFSGISRWWLAARAAGKGKELYKFGKTAAEHIANPNRRVPIQILDDVIKNTSGFADPKGSRALMYYSRIWRNGKLYNLEVLYDKASNSIWHFEYARKAMGPLELIMK